MKAVEVSEKLKICVPRSRRRRRRVIISGIFPRFIAFTSNWATDAFDTAP